MIAVYFTPMSARMWGIAFVPLRREEPSCVKFWNTGGMRGIKCFSCLFTWFFASTELKTKLSSSILEPGFSLDRHHRAFAKSRWFYLRISKEINIIYQSSDFAELVIRRTNRFKKYTRLVYKCYYHALLHSIDPFKQQLLCPMEWPKHGNQLAPLFRDWSLFGGYLCYWSWYPESGTAGNLQINQGTYDATSSHLIRRGSLSILWSFVLRWRCAL